MMGEKWCILWTKGRFTMPLAASLLEDGYDVWTPIKIEQRAKREVSLPLTSGLVFARVSHLFDFLELAQMPEKPRRARGRLPAHRPFTVFRCFGKLAIVDDADLEPLRRAERRTAKPVWAQRAFRRGQKVRATNGSFQGLTGFVKRSDKRATVVCFGGLLERVEIPTSLLSDDEAYRLQPETDMAALKAA